MTPDARWSTDFFSILDASGAEVLFDSRQWSTSSGAV